jgi:hypothetical protein
MNQTPEADQERLMNIRIATEKQSRRIGLLTPILWIIICLAGVAVGINGMFDDKLDPSPIPIFRDLFGADAGNTSLLLICVVFTLVGIVWLGWGVRRLNEDGIRRDLEKKPYNIAQFY